jgi:vesicle-fusing ATPase
LEIRVDGRAFLFSPVPDRNVPRGVLGFSLIHRKWAYLSINQDIDVRVFAMDPNTHCIGSVVFEVDYFQKKAGPGNEQFDTDAMAKEFCMQFHHLAVTKGQPLVFSFQGRRILQLFCKDIEGELEETEAS